ncbi:MAG: sulfotransferase [Deltaproteobacteria bacterium]|nr:sulfotransferase [Deltaproteobacteria bacterium]
MPWTPPERASWVDRLNVLGESLGDGGRALAPLDEETLLRSAREATGLDDFGDDWFREPLRIFLLALEEEARLNLIGRLLARLETQRILENRLRIEDHWKRHPEVERERIEAPLVVTGLGRSGTTFLHDLLACDPTSRAPTYWEMMYSVPPPEPSTYDTDPRILAAHREVSLMDEVIPSLPSMQEVGGGLASECIYLLAHQLATDMFVGNFDVPSYMTWTITTDQKPAYDYHRRLLQLLQSRHRGERWALKAPSHLHNLPLLFATYPDARVVITHRDPLRQLGSISNLMATIRWMRSDRVDYDGIVQSMGLGFKYQLAHMAKLRDDGAVPNEQILDVRYADLVANPLESVRGIYGHFGIPFRNDFEERLRERLASRPRSQRGVHEYSFADTGLDLATERARHVKYQERYGVPSEV